MDHPLPWLRYVKADDLHDKTIPFGGFEVKNVAGDALGDVSGFILDGTTGDPYYIVVDSTGWFKTRHYLVPIGHARLDGARNGIVVDLTRDQVKNFPGFDLDHFQEWPDEALTRFDRETSAVCCVDARMAAEPTARWSAHSHYHRPDWWDNRFYRPELAGEAGVPPATWGTEPEPMRPAREAVRPDREAMVAQADDTSPHVGGRAQAGDVIGIETGGERTYLGETTEDENERRRDAEKAASKLKE